MEIEDDYGHPEIEGCDGMQLAAYVPSNIPGKGCPEEFYQALASHCACNPAGDCQNKPCPCSRLVECHEDCACSPKHCQNRVVQSGPHTGLYVENTASKGLGLFCQSDLSRGVFVTTYSGEVISIQVGLARNAADKESRSRNYIIFVRETSQKSGDLKKEESPKDETVLEFAVDPTAFSNLGRYINHSCDPNLFMRLVRCRNSAVPQLALFARRFITRNEELTFDYGNPSCSSGDRPGLGDVICECQATKCRGFLPYHNEDVKM